MQNILNSQSETAVFFAYLFFFIVYYDNRGITICDTQSSSFTLMVEFLFEF